MNLENILKSYNLDIKTLKIEPFGSGLINHTWAVYAPDKTYILQRVNNKVFKVRRIERNIRLIGDYLRKKIPDYFFVNPIQNTEGGYMFYKKGQGYFRIFPFVPNSHSKDVVQTPEQAYEAASQFGRFTRHLADFDVHQLKDTIPNFHNLTLRYKQFLSALENGNGKRIEESQIEINFLKKHNDISDTYEAIKKNPQFKKRVMHLDTKISNVLFDAHDKGLCVIDLDTVMSGYFISDVGDMMRTYLSPVSEEEQDFSKIVVREDFYKAIVKGYYEQMHDVLTDTEKQYFFYAGKFMIYMQALRFLTDYLNNDIYYGAKYSEHNLIRAKNQIVLLERLMENEDLLNC